MAVPTHEEMFNPLLEALHSLGGSASIRDIEQKVAEIMNLSKEDLSVPHKGKKGESEFSYRLHWTRTYLKKYGVITNHAKAMWSLTEKGKNISYVEKDNVNRVVRSKDNTKPKIDEVDINSLVRNSDLNSSHSNHHHLRDTEKLEINKIIDMAESKWVLPDFQRYYDWKKEDVRSYLEAIFNGYFVGSFLLWEVKDDPEVSCFPIEGVREIKSISNPSHVILDGQQRITSLYYAIRSPSMKDDRLNCYFYINLRAIFEDKYGDLIVDKKEKLSFEECAKGMLFPLFEIPNYNAWLDDFEDFIEKEKDVNKEDATKLRRIIRQKIENMWEGFKIPYIELPSSMDVSHVVNIFENLNSKGKSLSAFDLLIASSLKYGVSLRNLWEDSSQKYPDLKRYYKHSEKLRLYIVQSILLSYSKSGSCKRKDMLNIYSNLYKNDSRLFESHWKEMSYYISLAIRQIENLRDGFGSLDEKHVPFLPTLPILASLIKEISGRSDKRNCYGKMKQWYWSVVFNEAYSSSVDTQLSSDFKQIKSWFDDDSKIPKNVQDARKEINNLNLIDVQRSASAIYKGVLSLLALEGCEDFITGQKISEREGYQKDHIFPKEGSKDYDLSSKINSILNMTWLTREANQKKKNKDPSEYFKEFKDNFPENEKDFYETLETHVISDEAYKYLLEDKMKEFLLKRQEDLLQKIKKMIGVSNVESINTKEKGDELVNQFEASMQEFLDSKLNLKHGENWEKNLDQGFRENIEKRIRNYLNKHSFKKRNEMRFIDFLQIWDYFKLIKQNWDIFKDVFGSRSELEKHFSNVNELRNSVKHPNRPMEKTTKDLGEASLGWFNQVLNK